MYQGWSNVYTWRVGYILANTKQYHDICLQAVATRKRKDAVRDIMHLCTTIAARSEHGSDHNDMKRVDFTEVNWWELYEVYQRKIREGAYASSNA